MAFLRQSSKSLIGCLFIALNASPATANLAETPSIQETIAAEEIDSLVTVKLTEQERSPAPAADEYVFARRVYLDTIGRIPTVSELETYVDYEHPDKRNRLIDYLSTHPGRTSHQFNIWADLLRVKSQTQEPGLGAAYSNWIKEAISQNLAYDDFVRELVTAEGYPWETGAVGYSMRDAGMPLDNLSNTVQVFLGTQIVCAQCHDHPFDDWTQHQYYETAAMTYGLHTRIKYLQIDGYTNFRKLLKDSSLDKRDKNRVRIASSRAFRPLTYGTSITDRELKLPHDYQYDDAEPNQIVEPYPLYGDLDQDITIDNRLHLFADWLTNPENPRFARTIANRTWKRLMGIGIFEPVDDYRPNTKISNPALLEYLESLLVDLEFDLRAFERIILKTQTYQRQSLSYTPEEAHSYAFEGQQIKRLSAEQIWDSLIAIISEDPESAKRPYDADLIFSGQKALLNLSPYQMAHLSLEYANKDDALREKIIATNKASKEAQKNGDSEELRRLRSELAEYNRERRSLIQSLSLKYQDMPSDAQSFAQSATYMDSAMMYSDSMEATEERGRLLKRMRNIRRARASELQSPMYPGHLLRQLGQSDRLIVDNASKDASVPQALAMMNGSWHWQLWNDKSSLKQRIKGAYEVEDAINTLFKATLSRPANEEEQAILAEKLTSNEYTNQDLLWALLNSRQFIFIQ